LFFKFVIKKMEFSTMRAAILYGKEDLRTQEVDIPKVGEDEVLIRVKACGVCGTDARVYHQGIEKRWKSPIIMGHEITGQIVELGKEISGYVAGDRVTVAPICGCGICSFCLSGMENLCKEALLIGANYDGGFAEYMKIPGLYIRSGGLVKIPDEMAYEVGTLAEPVSCCFHGMLKAGIQPGDTVVIIGDGPIGLIHLRLAKKLGASRVIVTGHHEERLKLAKDLGANLTVNSKKEDPMKEILDFTNQEAAERVIVAVGSIRAVEQGIKILRDGGSIVVFGQYAEPGSLLKLDPDMFNFSEISVIGSVDATLQEFYRSVLLLPALKLQTLITHRFPIQSIIEAMETVWNRQGSKIIIRYE
jgi:L-iditol 2-dehydrogenase